MRAAEVAGEVVDGDGVGVAVVGAAGIVGDAGAVVPARRRRSGTDQLVVLFGLWCSSNVSYRIQLPKMSCSSLFLDSTDNTMT